MDKYKHGGSKKLVVLVLADYAGEDGVCPLSIKTISERACLGKRQAQRCINELVEEGILRCEQNTGSTNTYYFATDLSDRGGCHPCHGGGVTHDTRKAEVEGSPTIIEGLKDLKDLKHKPIQTAGSGERKGYSTDFDTYWKVYPRNTGKVAAYRCWNSRLKEGHTAEDMIAGATSYAAYCRQLGTEPQYIKLPQTFLGRDLWFAEDWTVPEKPKERMEW